MIFVHPKATLAAFILLAILMVSLWNPLIEVALTIGAAIVWLFT